MAALGSWSRTGQSNLRCKNPHLLGNGDKPLTLLFPGWVLSNHCISAYQCLTSECQFSEGSLFFLEEFHLERMSDSKESFRSAQGSLHSRHLRHLIASHLLPTCSLLLVLICLRLCADRNRCMWYMYIFRSIFPSYVTDAGCVPTSQTSSLHNSVFLSNGWSNISRHHRSVISLCYMWTSFPLTLHCCPFSTKYTLFLLVCDDVCVFMKVKTCVCVCAHVCVHVHVETGVQHRCLPLSLFTLQFWLSSSLYMDGTNWLEWLRDTLRHLVVSASLALESQEASIQLSLIGTFGEAVFMGSRGLNSDPCVFEESALPT